MKAISMLFFSVCFVVAVSFEPAVDLSTQIVAHCFIGLVRPFLSHQGLATGVEILVSHLLHLSITAGVCSNVPALIVVVAGSVNVAPKQLNHIVVSRSLLASPHHCL